MSTTRTRQTRQHEAAQLAAALTQAQTALTQARRAWGAWADTVRQDAEARHGVSYTDADPVILEDGPYGNALDLGTELDQALIDLTALIGHLWHAKQHTSHPDSAR